MSKVTNKEILALLARHTKNDDSGEIHEAINLILANMLETHSRAIACHCECLGMEAENSMAIYEDNSLRYGRQDYLEVVEKWGIMKGGKPII